MTEDVEMAEPEAPERAFLVRSYFADVTAGDGRTVDVRIVPYGETATADDGFGGIARGMPYQEEWLPGVFDGQLKAANRVLANVEHERGIAGVVGHGLALREATDGFYGSFKMHKTPEGDKALMLINEGVFEGVSLEAFEKKSVRTRAGVVQRVKAHLRNIAFCREGAFTGARVLAVREAPIMDEDLLLPDLDPDLVERCRRLGIKLPQRLEEHPDPDTPEQGTSGGTLRTDNPEPTEVRADGSHSE